MAVECFEPGGYPLVIEEFATENRQPYRVKASMNSPRSMTLLEQMGFFGTTSIGNFMIGQSLITPYLEDHPTWSILVTIHRI